MVWVCRSGAQIGLWQGISGKLLKLFTDPLYDRGAPSATAPDDELAFGVAGLYAGTMNRQNLALGFILLFSILLLGGLLWSTRVFEDRQPVEDAVPRADTVETRADPVRAGENPLMADLWRDISQCLGLRPGRSDRLLTERAQTLADLLEPHWGGPPETIDRWTTWNLRARDGREKQVRLEVNETDEGLRQVELRQFALDREGLPLPRETEPERILNPTNAVLKQILKEGEVTFKERAASLVFPGKGRFDFVEANDVLTEFEIVDGKNTFRCSHLKSTDHCVCLNAGG